MVRKKTGIMLGIMVVFLLASTLPSWGQGIGIRAGRYLDTEKYFLGGELISRVTGNLYFNPNAEYVFLDNVTYMTFNLDFHYDFYTRSALFFWLGSGLGILYRNPEGPPGSNVDLAANLIIGVGLDTFAGLVP